MTAFNRFVVSRPWWVVNVFCALTVFFAVGLTRLQVDFDIETMFPPDHPEIAYKNWLLEYFEIDEPVMVMIENDGPNGVFTPETLALVAFVTDEMESLAEIDGDDVVSLSAVDSITGDGDSLIVEPYFEDPPQTQAEADAIRVAVFDNPMMIGTAVSRDGQATIVAGDAIDGADKLALRAALDDIVARAAHGHSRLVIAGQPVALSEMVLVNTVEIRRVLPIVVATAAVVLALAMHNARGVLLPLMVVVTSIIWTLGAMGWTGSVFSSLNSPLPMMLVPVGIADGIHIIHRYMHISADRPELSKADTVFHTLQDMWLAVVMTSVTTAAGVGSLATSSITTNRNFGVFAAVGVMSAMVFSLTVLPALLVLCSRPRRGLARFVRSVAEEKGPLAASLRFVGDLVTKRPSLVFAVTALVFLASAAGFPRLIVDGSVLRNFPPSNSIRLADQAVIDRFGGSFPLEISVEGGAADAWKEPENLLALQAFAEGIEQLDNVGETRSIVDYIRRMNAVMTPDDPQGHRVPESRELVAQYLLLYSISGEPDDFHDVVDYDYEIANVRAQVGSDHSPAIGYVLAEVDRLAAVHLAPHGLKAHASGVARAGYEFVQLIIDSQIESIGAALVLVWLMGALMLRSVFGGLLTAVPVVLATFTTFGTLAWIGEPVGVTTAIMAAIAIGIGVDYAVHFVVRYRSAIQSGHDRDVALRKTLADSGVAIFYNAVVVIAGFLAMATSDFFPPRAMGLMVSWNMVVCFIATVTTLAALLYWIDPAFLRNKAQPPQP